MREKCDIRVLSLAYFAWQDDLQFQHLFSCKCYFGKRKMVTFIQKNIPCFNLDWLLGLPLKILEKK